MYLKNEIIKLRALEPEDLELLYAWENRPELWSNGNTLEPYSRYILKEYIAYSDKTIYEKRQLRLMIERLSDGAVMGTIDLFDFDPHHNRAGVGILIDTPYQQQGYATQAMKLLSDYAFGFLHIAQLYAQISVINNESLTLFKRCGFVQCGVLKNWLRHEDGYSDVILLQQLTPYS